ncbi:MAG: bifunctional folylpolyglutamate synthase/dihydrofolate synthase [Candidatus Omnitrophica bacterium]|nr:bifunctional folylpolyglutamate synthase/dihydrofolate synthase [Candidatus Omnitrophota bacterium]
MPWQWSLQVSGTSGIDLSPPSMTYPEAVRYLGSFINYEKISSWPYKESLKLERFKNFLASLDNPQNRLKCIHVAGTKGKGSTCAFIAHILRQAGFKTGLYTSPHLNSFRERIRILRPGYGGLKSADTFEGMISRRDFARIVTRLKPLITGCNRRSEYGPLSFFEAYTALAFAYFKEQKVDFAVLETGLGGRLDATSVCHPLVCAITPISYEHVDKLGDTLSQIAAEKAGIIKNIRGLVTVSAAQRREAGEMIRAKCRRERVKLYEVGRDIVYKHKNGSFSVRGRFNNYRGLKVRLLGRHQIANAALALAAVEALRFGNVNVESDAIKEGLYNAVWPARCEVISRGPWIILDGAQNIASALAIRKTVKDSFRYKKLILILGVSCDKDKKGICRVFYDLADKIILTKADNPRAAEPEDLSGYFKGKEIYITSSVTEAKEIAVQLARKDDFILVCGSLFVAGEFRALCKSGVNSKDDKIFSR